MSRFGSLRPLGWSKAFTFIELVLVLVLIGVTFTLISFKSGAYTYWREEGFIRRFSELIQFLHHQAISDQATYHLQINLKDRSYKVGMLYEEPPDPAALSSLSSVGTLSLELAAFLNPSTSGSGNVVPPPSFPSLAEPQTLPDQMQFENVRTMRGVVEPDQGAAYISFSPRGFSEFAVVHLRQTSGAPITLLVNPFTGLVDIFREYKDFEWSYSGGDKNNKE